MQEEVVVEEEEEHGMEEEGRYRLHRLLVGCDFCSCCHAVAGLHESPQKLILQCGVLCIALVLGAPSKRLRNAMLRA